jgi:hypothetical protein
VRPIFHTPACLARASEREGQSREKTQKTNKRIEKSIFPTSETPPNFAPLFGEVGEKNHHTQQLNTNKERKQGNILVRAPKQYQSART